MLPSKAFFVLLVAAAVGSRAAIAQTRAGPLGAGAEPNREQWPAPSPVTWLVAAAAKRR